VLEEGAQLVADPREQLPMTALGHVTSSYDSANCGRSIAMALIGGGRGRLGETDYATTPVGFAAARIAPLPFLNG
jgi:sarcosine oxidase subunit alpha